MSALPTLRIRASDPAYIDEIRLGDTDLTNSCRSLRLDMSVDTFHVVTLEVAVLVDVEAATLPKDGAA